MREIKFRAWDKKDKYMFDVKQINTGINIGDVCKMIIWEESEGDNRADGNDLVQHYGDTVELMQYTGLKDKNGKEIYEGDVLRIPSKNDWEKTHFQAYEVFWHDNDCADNHIGWQMNRVHNQGGYGESWTRTFLPKYVKEMEVIGNIYENPELLNA